MAITLGSVVRDVITGFEGVAVGRHEYLTGCARITVQPKKLQPDGKPVEAQWFDEQQLEVTEPARVLFDNGSTPGGPVTMPRRSL